MSGRFIVLDPDHVRVDNPLQRMQHGAGTKPGFGTGPIRAVAQADGVVIPVGESESQQQSSRGVEPERVDKLLAQQPHRGSAQDHHTLFVQPDDALVRTEVQQLREMERLGRRRNGARLSLHGAAPFYDRVPLPAIPRPWSKGMLLPDHPGHQPTDDFRDASNHKRHGQTDKQDGEGEEQRDAGRASQ